MLTPALAYALAKLCEACVLWKTWPGANWPHWPTPPETALFVVPWGYTHPVSARSLRALEQRGLVTVTEETYGRNENVRRLAALPTNRGWVLYRQEAA